MTTVAEAIAQTTVRPAEMRLGTVTLVNTNSLQVLVAAGPSIQAAYLKGNTPAVGDFVALIRQDATWLCLGALAGVGPNQVQNPSFEVDGAILTVPSKWFLAQLVGAGAPRVAQTGAAPDGLYELVVDANGATQDTYVYSSPISVAPGQQWSISGYTSATYPPGSPVTATGSLYALWFANDTNLYPTTSAADSLVATASNIGPFPFHNPVSGTVTVPAATTFMRVATRSGSAVSVSVEWDAVFARRIA